MQGQYIKSVFEAGPAELAGMLPGDHVLEVDGIDVTEMSHIKVCSEKPGAIDSLHLHVATMYIRI